MNRWIAFLPLAALAALGLLMATFGLHHDPHVTPDALVGKPLPARMLRPLAGGAPVPLTSEIKGATIVNLFASTCAPCIEESPALLALKSEGARIIGIAYKDDPEGTKTFLARYGDPFTEVLVDRDGRAGVDLGASGVPETFVVGANGVVEARYVSSLQPKDAEAILERVHGTAR